jgi:hypothetical protein
LPSFSSLTAHKCFVKNSFRSTESGLIEAKKQIRAARKGRSTEFAALRQIGNSKAPPRMCRSGAFAG